MVYRIICFVCLSASLALNAQDGFNKKQLFALIASKPADTTLVDAWNELAWPVYSYDRPDSSIYFANQAILLATKLRDVKRLSIAHRRIGITYINNNDIKKAMHHQEESYRLSEKIGFKRGMHLALNNMGVVYLNNGLLNKALSYFLRSLKIVEESGDFARLSSLYSNCGMIYRRTNDLVKSKIYFLKAQAFVPDDEENLKVINNSNLSTAYRNVNQLDSSAYYLAEAKKHINTETTRATLYNYNLTRGLFEGAMNRHEEALGIFLGMKDQVSGVNDEITLLINIAEEYVRLKQDQKALSYFKMAYELSRKHAIYNDLEYLSQVIAKAYEANNDLKKFAEMIKLHISYKDSNAKAIKVQQIIGQQIEFDFEKKAVADSIKFENQQRLNDAELQATEAKFNKERTFRIMLLVVLIIIIVFSVFIFNRFLLTRRQKLIIEKQKQLVELKNREITDSINYAKRLQAAILPQLGDIRKKLDFGVFYLPKDIIGGDFYFFEEYNGLIYLAVCDCTGHGVPGAMMSVVCHQALEKSIREFNLSDPALILNKTRQIIMESLNAAEQNIKDGMDCSLLVIDHAGGLIRWAGANNPLWMIRNSELVELRAEKQPVALYENAKGFESHQRRIIPGTYLYLATDGYGDQFGGPKGKKYKTRVLKEFLLSICHKTIQEQVSLLEANFSRWRGALDQVDDVTIGIIKL